jgi:amino acid transporter
MPSAIKQLLLGRPLHNREAAHQRLSNPVALAVFSSDALSSVAYATEEILLALMVVGTMAASTYVTPISLGIGLLLVIVAFSYRQTIKAYPGGGGAYIVAKENLGNFPGLVAGGALLIDYVLTVAVSISAGTAAITSAMPEALPYRVYIAVALVLVLALMNLRGVKESGAFFAAPTFFFVVMLAVTIVIGLVRVLSGDVSPVQHVGEASNALTLFILLRAFASGCTAMTGVEAIANGVQAFKQPEATNARKTLTWMAGILFFLFIGTSVFARVANVLPLEKGGVVVQTLLSGLGHVAYDGVFGGRIFYLILQASTALILILAANTSYADFPRLGSFMAGDGYLPKQLRDRGSRLVYSNGMNLLTAASILLIIAFGGETNRLIPLYAIGVFTSFTLSQAGMVVHWLKNREPGWHWSMAVNGLGAVTTLVVLVVIATAKFMAGAWIVLLLIPILVGYFEWVKHEYKLAAARVALPSSEESEFSYKTSPQMHNHVLLLFATIDRRLIRGVQYARSIKADSVEGLFVDVTGERSAEIRAEWERLDMGIPLTVLESPYREIIDPIRDYVCSIPRPTHDHVVTVIMPEYVPESPPEYMLHDQTSYWIKQTLFHLPGVILAEVPYHIEEFVPGARTDCGTGTPPAGDKPAG